MLNEKKRTWAEVKVSAFQRNMYQFRRHVPEDCKIMGVVKANAYGHGAVSVAQMLERFQCDWLGVATLDEAEQLRSAGIALPILILGYTPPEFVSRVLAADCVQALGSFETAKAYSREMTRTVGDMSSCLRESAGGRMPPLRVHLKLDTGMGRTGFDVRGGDVGEAAAAMGLPGIDAEGVFTHFACADVPSESEFTLGQFEVFNGAVAELEKKTGGKFQLKHCANSAAMLSYPQTCLDMVRCGIALYGVFPAFEHADFDLAPAMELKSRVVQVSRLGVGDSVSYGRRFVADRPVTVAVLPIGYADGLSRVLSGKLEFLVRGVRCHQIGTICMDMCMVDVTHVPDVKLGDVVTVFGHDGECVISVDELARQAGTISYEVLCGVSGRVPRVYIR